MIRRQRGRFTRGWGYIYYTATIMIIVSPSAPFVYTAILLLYHYTRVYNIYMYMVCVCVSPTSRCTCHRFPSLWQIRPTRAYYIHILSHTHTHTLTKTHIYIWYLSLHVYMYASRSCEDKVFIFMGCVCSVRSERCQI